MLHWQNLTLNLDIEYTCSVSFPCSALQDERELPTESSLSDFSSTDPEIIGSLGRFHCRTQPNHIVIALIQQVSVPSPYRFQLDHHALSLQPTLPHDGWSTQYPQLLCHHMMISGALSAAHRILRSSLCYISISTHRDSSHCPFVKNSKWLVTSQCSTSR